MVRIITVNVGIADTFTPEGLLAASKNELIERGVPGVSIQTAVIDPEESTIAEAIVKQTAFLKRGSGLLVLGAHGKGAKRLAGEAGKGLGSVAQYAVHHAKCPILLIKDKAFYEDHVLRRPQMKIICCVDSTFLSSSCVDAALRFTHKDDHLTLLHVEGDPVQAQDVERYWRTEAEKVMSSRGVVMDILRVPKGKDIVDTILNHTPAEEYNMVVLGSITLVRQKDQMALGSVAQAVAKKCGAHTCIVKNFSAI